MAVMYLTSVGILKPYDEQEDLKLALLGEVALSTASGRLSAEQITLWLRRIFEAPDPS
jgi:hypothetical protein